MANTGQCHLRVANTLLNIIECVTILTINIKSLQTLHKKNLRANVKCKSHKALFHSSLIRNTTFDDTGCQVCFLGFYGTKWPMQYLIPNGIAHKKNPQLFQFTNNKKLANCVWITVKLQSRFVHLSQLIVIKLDIYYIQLTRNVT